MRILMHSVRLFALLAFLAGPATAQDAPPAPARVPTEPGGVAVERFEFRYGLPHPDLPPIDLLGGVTVQLVRDAGVWHERGAAPGEELALGRVPAGSRFGGDALVAVTQALVNWFNARGLYGVWVVCADLETGETGIIDSRPPGDGTVRIVVWASQVTQLRTLARGSRFDPRHSIDNRKHRRILASSPLQPGPQPDLPGGLFRKDEIEGYLRRLSMHPGRRVEASIASAGAPGKVVLDYLVTEAKPWQVFSQFSNTGTETTGRWRGRLGFQHGQFTNHDDILNVDAISTPDFETFGGFLSYRLPVLRPTRLMARVYGSYGDFIANNPDVALQGLRFAGRNWMAGCELSNRTVLARGWELQTIAGANYTHYEIESQISGTTLGRGTSNFLVPFVGPAIMRDAGWWSLSGALRVDHALDGFANLDPNNGVPAMGRLGADPNWTSLRWNIDGSVFLEPWFRGGAGRAEYLANEVSLRVRGRLLLRGRRLISQEQEPLGGAFSVRGYPEAVLAADDFSVASLEYAFHFPLARKPGEPGRLFGRPFKWRPPQRQQRPDWDLALRAFVDYGYRGVSPAPETGGQGTAPAGERGLIDRNVSLAGAGVGVDIMFWRVFSVRCDVGAALMELRDNSRETEKRIVVSTGDMQAHLVATFAW